MKLALQVLDGPHKGKIIYLRDQWVFSSAFFNDPEMLSRHAVLTIDNGFNWKINGLGGSNIRAGLVEKNSLSLINGLVFHLGLTGFKVIEKPAPAFNSWEDAILEYLNTYDWEPTKSDCFFFLSPLRLTFLQGPQADQFYTISYGPRELGFNHFDLDVKDPSQPENIARFFQIGESVYIENLCGKELVFNKKPFSQEVIQEGDKIQFGSNIVEFSFV
ncbi:MAG: hypothetical protein ACK4VO_00445 [Pseudobdellovibrio sp.]